MEGVVLLVPQHFSAAGPTASSVFLHSEKAFIIIRIDNNEVYNFNYKTFLQSLNSDAMVGVCSILHFLISDTWLSREKNSLSNSKLESRLFKNSGAGRISFMAPQQ